MGVSSDTDSVWANDQVAASSFREMRESGGSANNDSDDSGGADNEGYGGSMDSDDDDALHQITILVAKKVTRKDCPCCEDWDIKLTSTDKFFRGDPKMYHQMVCHECNVHGPMELTQKDAVDAWNAMPRTKA